MTLETELKKEHARIDHSLQCPECRSRRLSDEEVKMLSELNPPIQTELIGKDDVVIARKPGEDWNRYYWRCDMIISALDNLR